MTVVYAITLAMLGLAMLGTLVRLVRGPSRFDRVLALDVLVVVFVSAVAVEAAWRRDGGNVVTLLVVALVGFVGTTAFARLAGGDEDR